MTLRSAPTAILLIALWLVASPVRTSCAESNEAFVRKQLRVFFVEVIDSLGLAPSSSVAIDFEPPAFDNLNVAGASLTDAIQARNLKRVRMGEANGSDATVSLALSRLEFDYENRNSTPFSRGDLYRVLQVAARFSILQGNSVLNEDFLVRSYEDQIELEERGDIENESSPLFHAELPSGPVQRFWEPVIVTSVIGGLVYLFFASR